MPALTKSVLLIEFETVRRTLGALGAEAGARFVTHLRPLLEALEDGALITPARNRQIVLRRCFADPEQLGDAADAFVATGFEIVPCPADAGVQASGLSMTINAVDILNGAANYDEFIIMSAGIDLTPLITRLKNDNRDIAAYVPDGAEPSWAGMVDATVSPRTLVSFIGGRSAGDARPVSRQEVETLARKVSSATNVPLFSPRTYADLFHHLAEEITNSGYNFQTTARNVADRLAQSGRNVTRRQVVFVVKGLALKGHVFSVNDTPRRLAEVFLEQARYLIDNAGMKVAPDEEHILSAWLVERSSDEHPGAVKKLPPPAKPAPAEQPTPEQPTPKPTVADETPAPKVAADDDKKADAAADAAKPDPVEPDKKPEQEAKPEPATGRKKSKKARKAAKSKSAAKAKAAKPRQEPPPSESEAPAPTQPDQEDKATETDDAPPAKRKVRTADEVKAEIAARIQAGMRERKQAEAAAKAEAKAAASEKSKQAKQGKSSEPGAPVAKKPKPPAKRRKAQAEPEIAADADANSAADDPLESSILAAIAEAVDVLVETDSGEESPDGAVGAAEPDADTIVEAEPPPEQPAAPPQPRSRKKGQPQEVAAPREPQKAHDDEFEEDIGDEIQRIIASYDRNRDDAAE